MLSLSISQLLTGCLCLLPHTRIFAHSFSLAPSSSLPNERWLFVEVSQHLMFAWHRTVMFTLLGPFFRPPCLPPCPSCSPESRLPSFFFLSPSIISCIVDSWFRCRWKKPFNFSSPISSLPSPFPLHFSFLFSWLLLLLIIVFDKIIQTISVSEFQSKIRQTGFLKCDATEWIFLEINIYKDCHERSLNFLLMLFCKENSNSVHSLLSKHLYND